MADGANSITLSINNCFPGIKRLMCWAHVQRAYSKKLVHIKNRDLENKIVTDLHALQLSIYRKNFLDGFKLLRKKYQREINSNNEVFQFFVNNF